MDIRLIDSRRRNWLARLPALLMHLLLWCAPLAVACVGWWLTGPLAVDVPGETGRDVLRGFYAPETGPFGSFRWSARQASLTLPARPAPAALEFQATVAPDGTRVTLALGDNAIVALPPAEALVSRRYTLLWPSSPDSFGLARLTIDAAGGGRAEDKRPLGLALGSVVLRPLALGPSLPPLGVLGALVLGPPLLAVCVAAAGVSPLAARILACAVGLCGALLWLARPLALQPLLFDLAASVGAPVVLRWLGALLLLGLAGLPATAFLFRTLPQRGLLFARPASLVLVGWLSWYGAAALRIPFGASSVAGAALLLAALGGWGLRVQGLREVLALVRSNWRVLLAGEAGFACTFCFGLWLRWNGAVGPAISGTEKPMDLALLQGATRDPAFPPLDLWFSGHAVNYYYLGYVQIAAVAKLAGASVGEAFNLGMATVFGLSALSVAVLVGTLCALDGRRGTEHEGTRARRHEEQTSLRALVSSCLRVHALAGRIAVAALLGIILVLFAGNQIGALQVLLGGSQVRALDGAQLAEALWQRATGANAIRLGTPTPPAPDFGVITGWTPAEEARFDWWSPSRSIMDDIATPVGLERRAVITEFPFFSFFLGDLHAHLLAIPHGLLVVALALAVVARPTLPVYFATRRGWLELGLTAVVLASLYAVNAWDAPGAWLLFAGALALLYHKASAALDRRSLFVHGALVSLGLVALVMTAAAPFMSAYRAPFGNGEPHPWEGVPLLESLGRVVGPAPAHTGLHGFLAMFGLFLLPLLALVISAGRDDRGSDIAGQVQQMLSSLRASVFGLPWLDRALWAVTILAFAGGAWLGMPLLALLPLAFVFAYGAWRAVERPALALALWGAAIGALLVFAADTVYVRDQLEGSMSRYITVFKLYFQAWVLWGTLAAYAVWAVIGVSRDGTRRHEDTKTRRRQSFVSSCLRVLVAGLWLLLLVGALVYPVETLRRGERWAPSAREVDGLAFLARETPDEAAGIGWLAANVRAEDVVLTAWCECRSDEIGRVAAAAGVSTLLGRSEGHQRLWRAGWSPWLAEIAERERDVPLIYAAADAAKTRDLLVRYGVDYVYIGVTERAVHGGPGLEKLGALLEPVFAQGTVRIYRVPQERR